MTPPAGGVLSGVSPEFFGLNAGPATSPNSLPSTPPSAPLIPPPSGNYLPQFPFGHPDLLQKSGFLPYDLAAFRANGMRPTPNTTAPSLPSNDRVSSSHASPASSRNSSSSPPMGAPTGPHINNSVEFNSTNEQSSDPDSDDEQIDVVKSAFVPILRPTIQVTSIQTPTIQTTAKVEMVVDSPMSVTSSPSPPTRIRCDLKAPSSKKPIHEMAPRSDLSPKCTKLRSESTHKTVWRPY